MFRVSELPDGKLPKVAVVCYENPVIRERVTELLKNQGVVVASPQQLTSK